MIENNLRAWGIRECRAQQTPMRAVKDDKHECNLQPQEDCLFCFGIATRHGGQPVPVAQLQGSGLPGQGDQRNLRVPGYEKRGHFQVLQGRRP